MKRFFLLSFLCSLTLLLSANTITYKARQQIYASTDAFSTSPTSETYSDSDSIGTFVFARGNLTRINSGAFHYNNDLLAIYIPDGVTRIGAGAFEYCKSMTSIDFGNTVSHLASLVFLGCSALVSVTIPPSVTTIDNQVFACCRAMTSISIPNSVTSCSFGICEECSALITANIPDSWRTIPGSMFSGCSSLPSITIPDSIIIIYGSAFSGCSSLTSIRIPPSVTAIYRRAFKDCTGITSITIPSSVDSIGAEAFLYVNNIDYHGTASGAPWGAKSMNGYVEGCLVYADSSRSTLLGCSSAATSISIPASVIGLGDHALRNCTALNSLSCAALLPPSLDTNSFLNVGKSTHIFVPYGSISSYKAADGWKTFTNYHGLLPWQVTASPSDTAMGHCDYVQIPASQPTIYTVTLSATAHDHHRFIRWSDGCTDNPRTLNVTCDTAFVAEFVRLYTLTTAPDYPWHGTTSGDTIAVDHDTLTLSATPFYGYHFTRWSDGSTQSTRTLVLTRDTSLVAEFARNPYTLTTTSTGHGTTLGDTTALYLDTLTVSAIPDPDYRFVRWSDGCTDNPRTLVLTRDTAFVAEFALHTYTITTLSDSPERGTTAGDTTAIYLDTLTVSATPFYGYHFTRWSDGLTANPRTIILTQDTAFVAQFDRNAYTLITSPDFAERGTTSGDTTAFYLDLLTFSATPLFGYAFTGWSDTLTDNPRTLVLTRDTAFVAHFDLITSGFCGSRLQWTWADSLLTIDGSGDMYDYTSTDMPWLLLRDSTTRIKIDADATSVGECAFYRCTAVTSITCLATVPPYAGRYCFQGMDLSIPLYVHAESVEAYRAADGWKEFGRILSLESALDSPDSLDDSPDSARKIIRDGRLLILRHGVTYDATGIICQ